MSGSSKNLGLQEQQQQQSNWCWAATTVSITLYYQPGLGLTQCQLVNRALGMSSCCQAPLGWDWQTLTGGGGGNTDGPPAAGDPAVVSYNDQMHVCYRDTSGLIQDAWYDGHGNWNLQQLTGGGNTDGPTAAGDPALVSYNDQMHVCYRDTSGSLLPGVAAGLIQDAWYDGHGNWHLQTLTGGGGGNTDGPPAAGDPAVVSYNDQMHVCYRDTSGLIQDAWYDGHGNWNLQQLTGGGNTDGPTAAGDPALVSYNDQMHVCYRDTSGSLLPGVAAGLIQDAWYDGHGNWHLQTLTGGGGGNTDGPPAAGDPAVVSYNDQMHVCYRDTSGLIQDAWYDGHGNWNLQQLTGGGNTDGPTAAGDPALVSYNDQMHVCYRDTSGLIQDAWYDGHGNWNLQQLTGGGNTDGPTAVGNPAPVSYGDQMHVCYRDTSGSLLPGVAAGLIQDAWYIGSTCNVPGEPDEALTITGHFASDTGSLPLSGSGGLFSSSVINEIDGKRPISIGILWNSGSAIGHNPSIEGYDTFGIPTIDIQDPLHGFSIQDFHTFPSTYFGGATWAQSFLTRP